MSQPPPRPWFRLASMVRPPPPRPPTPAPAPAPVQPQPFRPQVPLTQPAPQPTPRPPAPFLPNIVTPRASAPPSPIQTPIAPPPPQPTAPPPSPQSKPPPPAATITDQSPKSPAKTASPSTIRSPPTISSAQTPPPPISFKLASPITKTSTSSLPASPGQNASTQITVTRPEVSYSSPKPKPSASSAPPPSPLLSTTPAFRTVPSSPAPPTVSSVTNAVSIPKGTRRATTTTTISAMASPKAEKPWVESPPQPSNKEKLLSYPPSPLALPPAAQIKAGSDQLEPIPAEIEQKTILMQEKEKKASNGYVIRSSHSEISKGNSAAAQQQQVKLREARKGKVMNTYKKQNSDSEEYGSRVVTLAGENKGAIMELSPSRKKNGSWSNRGHKLEEGISKKKDEKHKGWGTETVPMDAFVNCNVQGVNNSILYNCSCTHNDPGVHLALSKKTNGGGHGVHH